MKKIFTLCLGVLFVAMAMAQPEAIVKKASVNPVVDGVMDPVYFGANVYNIAVPLNGEAATLGDEGTTNWRAVWSDEGIYVFLTVNDDIWDPSYISGGNSWEYDKPELYFDANAVKLDGNGPNASRGVDHPSAGHYQFAPAALEEAIDGTPQTDAGNGAINSFLATSTTWKAEYFIPFSALKDKDGADLNKTAPIGFDVTIIDRDDVDPGRLRHDWANDGSIGESWDNMDGCGTITLSDEVAVEGTIVKKAATVPVIDGVVDEVWATANTYNIAVPFKAEAATVGALGETTWKSSVTDSLFCRFLKTKRLFAVVSSFAFVIRGSTTILSAFAFAVVVNMRLCIINEIDIFDNIALR